MNYINFNAFIWATLAKRSFVIKKASQKTYPHQIHLDIENNNIPSRVIGYDLPQVIRTAFTEHPECFSSNPFAISAGFSSQLFVDDKKLATLESLILLENGKLIISNLSAISYCELSYDGIDRRYCNSRSYLFPNSFLNDELEKARIFVKE
jgi:hypothetical protein